MSGALSKASWNRLRKGVRKPAGTRPPVTRATGSASCAACQRGCATAAIGRIWCTARRRDVSTGDVCAEYSKRRG